MEAKHKFPATFWAANTVELFERGAYYAIASFVVIYLKETLGMSPTFATFLNGTLLWGIIYFMPILSGTLADKYGFKRSLSLSFILLVIGYVLMGTLQKFWAGPDCTVPVVAAILCIGIGGSFVKPCISGTVQKTSGAHTVLGFGIFYMTINIGSMLGRIVSYNVRVHYGIPAIFTWVATLFAVAGLLVTLLLYREPRYHGDAPAQPSAKPKTLGAALAGMFTVLADLKFVFFLIVIGLFWVIYVQIYNLVPLFLRFVDPDAAVELYTLINPVMIVAFQMLITKFSKGWTALASIMVGIAMTVAGMMLNVIPWAMGMDPFAKVPVLGIAFPAAGLFMLGSIGAMAVGEMFTSPRVYQYIGGIAPKGQEGLYLGYANLPLAIGTIVGAPAGGYLFERLVQNPHAAGEPVRAVLMWSLVAFMGVLSLGGIWLYDRLVRRG
jgi:dipeptide/tripeptide permease